MTIVYSLNGVDFTPLTKIQDIASFHQAFIDDFWLPYDFVESDMNALVTLATAHSEMEAWCELIQLVREHGVVRVELR
jgi:hypothetical protein